MGKRSSQVTSVIRFAAPEHPACNAIDQSEITRPDGEREQTYRRKIRPQSEGQRRLLAAIERHI
jgi:hypothetical protein